MSDEDCIYPCADCGIMRSEAEGGTIFTVCDKCWDKAYRPATIPERNSLRATNEKLVAERDEALAHAALETQHHHHLRAERDSLRLRVEELEKEVERAQQGEADQHFDLLAARADVERLELRQQELLATIVRVTNETPFSNEAADALKQRGVLLAEIGSLRADVAVMKDARDEWRDEAARIATERRSDEMRAIHERDSALARLAAVTRVIPELDSVHTEFDCQRESPRDLVWRFEKAIDELRAATSEGES